MDGSKKPIANRINTYSYYKTSDNNKDRSARKSKGSSWRYFSLKGRISLSRLLLILGMLGVMVFLMSADTQPIIRLTSNGVMQKRDEYQKSAQQIIDRSIFNRSKVLFNYQDVRSKMMLQFPEIERLDITFGLIGRKPIFRIITRQPVFIYQTGGGSWIIDSRGVVIGAGEEIGGDINNTLSTIIDENDIAGGIGETLLSSKQVSFISSVIANLEKQQVLVDDIYIPTTPKELDLTVVGEGWRYKLNTDESPVLQAGTIISVRQTLSTDSLSPAEYVDVRSGEKVYWK